MSELIPHKQKLNNIRQVLDRAKPEMAKLLQSSVLTPDALARFALTACTKNPQLLDCSVESIGLSLLVLADIGLAPDGRNAHLVAYGRTCQPIIDYKGLVKLAYQNPRVKSVTAGCVRENDDFDYEEGTNAFIRHKILHTDSEEKRGEITWAYAIYRGTDGSTEFVVMPRYEIDKRKNVAKTKNIWRDWPDEMAAKSAVKKLAKFAPLGFDVERAVGYDDKIEIGERLEFEREPARKSMADTVYEGIEDGHQSAEEDDASDGS